jgi:EAL and modified HD-GYP domain-containing signal transduction protein
MFTFFAHLLRQRAPALPGRAAPPVNHQEAPQDDDGADDLAVLRHAVLNRDKQIAGYAFFQAEDANATPAEPGHDRAFLKFVESVVAGPMLGKRRAFMAVAARLLCDPMLEQLARSGVVVLLRFGAQGEDLATLAQRMQALRAAGLRVGLADVRVALAHPELGKAASLGFVPVDLISPPDLLQAVRQLHSLHPHLLMFASGVRYHEEFEVCRRLKMQGFAGSFASHRRDWSNNTIDPGTVRLCKLVTSLRSGAEMDRIIADIKLDPLLAYRVLSYANSAAVGAQHKVQTLKDAILLIGREPLFRWLVLLLCASAPTQSDETALIENALVRGRMMELLAGHVPGAVPEDCFLTGVLSLLDVMLQQDAVALFQPMDLPEAVKPALLDGQGPYASLLRLVEACEQQRSEGIAALCTALEVAPRKLSQVQADALLWARGQAGGDAEEATFAVEPSVAEPALQAVRDAAQGGEPQAQCELGARYAAGDGVVQDWAESLAWYTRAAEQGHAKAQWNAAVMHAHGQGCAQVDEAQAFMWCQKAADQGFAAAQATLGLMYSSGQGAEKDLHKAIELLEQAALQGDVEAQYNLAVLQAKELGGEQDLKQALLWFARAAEQGLPAAQEHLGLMLAMGQAGAPDLVEAYKWFVIAHQGQHPQAEANMAHSRTLMQPDQVQEAEQRATRWLQDRC